MDSRQAAKRKGEVIDMLQDTPTEAMITTKEAARLIKEARASEQDKATAIQILAFEQGIAEGYNHGQASVMATCSDCQKVQRKKGQADLIGKLTSREIIIKMLNENYKVPDLMAGSYTKNEVLRNEEQRIDAVRAVMLKAASESAEAKGDVSIHSLPHPMKMRVGLQASSPANSAKGKSESAGGNVAIGKPELQDNAKPEKPPPYTCQECGERHCWITEANRSHKKTKPENACKRRR